MRTARVVATIAALLILLAGTALGTGALWPTTTAAFVAPTAVFLGDSYTQAGGLPEAQRWPTIVAQKLGWRAVNLGRGGTGYLGDGLTGAIARIGCGRDHCPSYQGMIPAAAAENPAIIVVSGGRNDRHYWRDPIWALGVIGFYQQLREAAPDADIYATSPIWDDDLVPPEAIFAKAIVRVAVEDIGGTYIDLREPLARRPDLIDRDGVHPNAAGHAAIAAAFIAAVR